TATQLGGIIGGGTNEQIEALAGYGKYLGIAYQVHDDMLDWGAKDKVTLALKQGNEESSILSELRSLTTSYSKKAKEQLQLLPDTKARRLLRELTDFSVQRDF
ncbi:MAG: polyprenyl synthetase family protein, partial [Nitrososphaerales archaeon]